VSYRDDIAALAARKAALDAEVAHCTKQRDETAQLLAEATARLHEQEHAEQEQRRRAMMPTRQQRMMMAAMALSTLAISAMVGQYTPAEPPPSIADQPLLAETVQLTVGQTRFLANLPAECRGYYDEVRVLSTCDGIPREAIDTLTRAFDDAARSWARLPAEALPSLADACRAGRDAVHRVAHPFCWRPRADRAIAN
jgi:hypothetical protein